MNGRVPPHSLEAEAAVLSAILLEGRAALDQVVDLLKPERFYSDAHAWIYEAAEELAAGAGAIDVITVVAWLQGRGRLERVGGAAYLAQLADETPAVANLRAHAEIVRGKWRVRNLIATCHRVAAEGYEATDAEAFLDEAEQAVYRAAQSGAGSTTAHVSVPLGAAFTEIFEAAKRGETVTGVPTGFTDLDHITGGLQGGDLVIVAGRPSMGKTAFGLELAIEAARTGRGAAVFSLEMGGKALAVRLLATHARVDVRRLRLGRLDEREWSRAAAGASEISSLPLWLDECPGISVTALRGKVRRLRARHEAPLGLVVVDYLQLMRGREGPSREQEISEISRGLKQLAGELGIPVVALSQLNRAVEGRADKRPLLSDLRESGALEQDADVVLLLYRDEYYNPNTTKDRGVAEVNVGKQRNGPTGTVKLKFTASCSRFDNLAVVS